MSKTIPTSRAMFVATYRGRARTQAMSRTAPYERRFVARLRRSVADAMWDISFWRDELRSAADADFDVRPATAAEVRAWAEAHAWAD